MIFSYHSPQFKYFRSRAIGLNKSSDRKIPSWNWVISSKITIFLELHSLKTVRFSKQILSAEKYPSYFRAKWRLSFMYASPTTTLLRTRNVTGSSRLDSSLGRALQWYRRGHGFESRSGLNFIQAFTLALLKLCARLQWSVISSNCLFPQFWLFIFLFVVLASKRKKIGNNLGQNCVLLLRVKEREFEV